MLANRVRMSAGKTKKLYSVTRSAGLAANISSSPYTNRNFLNLNNVYLSDDVYAYTGNYLSSSYPYSQILAVRNFGFNIPEDSVIKGIEVLVEASIRNNNPIYAFVGLTKNGTDFIGGNLSDGSPLKSADEIKIFGSAKNLWGLSLTPSDINSVNFGAGVAFTYEATRGIPQVDHIQMTVHYEI